MCLNRARTVLCGGRAVMRVPTAKTTLRNGDRPHQLHRLLGQPIQSVDDGRGLRAHAGVAVASDSYELRPGTSLNFARALSENRSSGGHVRTSHRAALTAGFPLSGYFFSSGPELGCSNWIVPPHSATEKQWFVNLMVAVSVLRQTLASNIDKYFGISLATQPNASTDRRLSPAAEKTPYSANIQE